MQGAVSQSSKIAERLLAHARLCRQIAGASWNEASAERLEQLAAECDRAARDAQAQRSLPTDSH
jgi:hypothetical protein